MPPSKTETIDDRKINVYLPTIEETEKWKDIAEEKGKSLSKWVYEIVKESLAESDDNTTSRAELVKRNEKMREELNQLRKENERLKKVLDRYESELEELRGESFLQDDFKGKRRFSKELVNLLRDKGKVRYNELYEHLDIDPTGDMIESLQKQIKELETYGLIEHGSKYLRWKG